MEKRRKQWHHSCKRDADFSHIDGISDEEKDLPWDYKNIVSQYLKDDMELLDYDTGGGEFLLSLNHPFKKT